MTIAILLATPTWGSGQETAHQTPLQAYFAFGSTTWSVFSPGCYDPPPTSCYSTGRAGSNIAFGGEERVAQGLSAGFEVAYAGPDWTIGSNGLGVVSANATHHFGNPKRPRKLEPFVTGGYSLYFGEQTNIESGFNVGGGVNIWATKRAALRLEIREQGHANYIQDTQFLYPSGKNLVTNFVAFRVGVTFR